MRVLGGNGNRYSDGFLHGFYAFISSKKSWSGVVVMGKGRWLGGGKERQGLGRKWTDGGRQRTGMDQGLAMGKEGSIYPESMGSQGRYLLTAKPISFILAGKSGLCGMGELFSDDRQGFATC